MTGAKEDLALLVRTNAVSPPPQDPEKGPVPTFQPFQRSVSADEDLQEVMVSVGPGLTTEDTGFQHLGIFLIVLFFFPQSSRRPQRKSLYERLEKPPFGVGSVGGVTGRFRAGVEGAGCRQRSLRRWSLLWSLLSASPQLCVF